MQTLIRYTVLKNKKAKETDSIFLFGGKEQEKEPEERIGWITAIVDRLLMMFRPDFYIGLDFADLRAILKNSGTASAGIGIASGDEGAWPAAQACLASVKDPSKASSVCISVRQHSEGSLEEVGCAVLAIQSAVDPDAMVVFGASIDDKVADRGIEVIAIFTGYLKP